MSRKKPELKVHCGHSSQTIKKTKQNIKTPLQKYQFGRPKMGMLRHRSVTPRSDYHSESPFFRVLEGVHRTWNLASVFQKVKRTISRLLINIYKYIRYQVYLYLAEIISSHSSSSTLYCLVMTIKGLVNYIM